MREFPQVVQNLHGADRPDQPRVEVAFCELAIQFHEANTKVHEGFLGSTPPGVCELVQLAGEPAKIKLPPTQRDLPPTDDLESRFARGSIDDDVSWIKLPVEQSGIHGSRTVDYVGRPPESLL